MPDETHGPADEGAELPEITYDEQRYEARPRRLRPRQNLRGGSLRRSFSDPRAADGRNPAYIEWLVRTSEARRSKSRSGADASPPTSSVPVSVPEASSP